MSAEDRVVLASNRLEDERRGIVRLRLVKPKLRAKFLEFGRKEAEKRLRGGRVQAERRQASSKLFSQIIAQYPNRGKLKRLS